MRPRWRDDPERWSISFETLATPKALLEGVEEGRSIRQSRRWIEIGDEEVKDRC